MFNGGRYGRYFDVANGGRHWKHWVFRVGRERAGHGSAGRRNNAEVRRVRRGVRRGWKKPGAPANTGILGKTKREGQPQRQRRPSPFYALLYAKI